MVNLTVGAFTAVMAAIAPTATILSVSTDRMTLTASAPLTVPPGLARHGGGFLETTNDGTFPLQAVRVEGSTITLSRALHRDVDLSSGTSTWQWSTYQTQLGPANVTAVVDYEGIEWVADYLPSFATSLTDDSGLLYVVRRPFTTGLSTHSLLARFPSLDQSVTHSQTGFDQQIDMAFTVLVQRLRADLVGRNLTEDDVQHAQDGLVLAHSHLAMSIILDDAGDPDGSERHLEAAFGRIDTTATILGVRNRRLGGIYSEAMHRVWVDADRDGVVEDDEIIDVAGPQPTVSGSGFPTTPRRTMDESR